MNQRVHNLSKWRLLTEGEVFTFAGEPRTVILEVNCPAEACFYVQQSAFSDGEDVERPVSFLGVAKGRDRFEFAVNGDFDLTVEGGDAYVYTFDGQLTAHHVVAPEIYTRMANRKARNPNLEMIEYRMKLNQQRFFAQLEAEQMARIEAVKHELASYKAERNPVAPAGLVGKAEVEDGVAEPAVAEVVADVEPAAKSSRKRKSDQGED